jgi:hypothetical protein
MEALVWALDGVQKWMRSFFFFETEAKESPHQLIKKKRITQFINRKPDKNRYNKNTDRLLPKNETPRPPLRTNKNTSQVPTHYNRKLQH